MDELMVRSGVQLFNGLKENFFHKKTLLRRQLLTRFPAHHNTHASHRAGKRRGPAGTSRSLPRTADRPHTCCRARGTFPDSAHTSDAARCNDAQPGLGHPDPRASTRFRERRNRLRDLMAFLPDLAVTAPSSSSSRAAATASRQRYSPSAFAPPLRRGCEE